MPRKLPARRRVVQRQALAEGPVELGFKRGEKGVDLVQNQHTRVNHLKHRDAKLHLLHRGLHILRCRQGLAPAQSQQLLQGLKAEQFARARRRRRRPVRVGGDLDAAGGHLGGARGVRPAGAAPGRSPQGGRDQDHQGVRGGHVRPACFLRDAGPAHGPRVGTGRLPRHGALARLLVGGGHRLLHPARLCQAGRHGVRGRWSARQRAHPQRGRAHALSRARLPARRRGGSEGVAARTGGARRTPARCKCGAPPHRGGGRLRGDGGHRAFARAAGATRRARRLPLRRRDALARGAWGARQGRGGALPHPALGHRCYNGLAGARARFGRRLLRGQFAGDPAAAPLRDRLHLLGLAARLLRRRRLRGVVRAHRRARARSGRARGLQDAAAGAREKRRGAGEGAGVVGRRGGRAARPRARCRPRRRLPARRPRRRGRAHAVRLPHGHHRAARRAGRARRGRGGEGSEPATRRLGRGGCARAGGAAAEHTPDARRLLNGRGTSVRRPGPRERAVGGAPRTAARLAAVPQATHAARKRRGGGRAAGAPSLAEGRRLERWRRLDRLRRRYRHRPLPRRRSRRQAAGGREGGARAAAARGRHATRPGAGVLAAEGARVPRQTGGVGRGQHRSAGTALLPQHRRDSSLLCHVAPRLGGFLRGSAALAHLGRGGRGR
mmetsp:Transcript_45377/g.104723  ORF Transcript_45377/g.104723 Transcript_45377/m.104723 type:complete len:667 (-) Transcript_45377:1286-3286(-)